MKLFFGLIDIYSHTPLLPLSTYNESHEIPNQEN
jgi:hypothetical protein